MSWLNCDIVEIGIVCRERCVARIIYLNDRSIFSQFIGNAFLLQVVVITGASSGLGEALAHNFYVAGCKVVLAARRREELERVRTDLLEIHSVSDVKVASETSTLSWHSFHSISSLPVQPMPTHPPIVLPLDLTDLNSMPEKVAEVEKIFGYIDILINNGGVSVRSDVLSTAMDVDIKVMLVNYFGSVALTKGASKSFFFSFTIFCLNFEFDFFFPAALPTMLKRKEGRIVCVSSVQGKFSLPHRSAYSASKHAMQAFCDSLRAEVAEHNVKVLCVSPGYINTALSLNALTGSGRNYGSK